MMADERYHDILSVLDLENTLKCPVCFELRDGHIYMCKDGHHLCRVCRGSLNLCPLCQCQLSFSRNFVAETLISKYEFLKESINHGPPTESQERIFDFSVSDFAAIVKTTAFIDKTLMIRDIFNSSSQILITAPPRFGKSTNLNMVKRFVEIQLDEEDRPVGNDAIHTTENYSLFKDNNLEICTYDEVFNEHFAKYPVIYTDWKALGTVSDFASMIDVFRMIIVETFSLHRYILDSFIQQLRTNDIDIINFKKYFSEQAIKDMDIHDIIYSFKTLSRVLFRCFETKVYVLIDNYDAFVNAMLFKNNPNNNKIVSFINTVICHLLQNNHCVGRAVLTGVLPLTSDGFALHGSNIDCYSFLGDHIFCKYYGLTSDEFDKVLNKLEKVDQERIKMKRMINEYYNCYTAENQNIQVYSIWSVLQYLRKRKVQFCWSNHECISSLKSALCKTSIRNKIGQLLCGNLVQLNILQPLSTKDVLQLNSDSIIDRVLVLFYHLGCLSINRMFDTGSVDLKIPNEEIKYELAKLLLEANYSQEFVDNMKQVGSAVDSFRPDSPDKNKISETFYETLQVWSHYRWVTLARPHDYLTRLFIGLITVPEYRHTVTHKLGPDGLTVILLKNKHNVAICITAEEDTSDNPTDETIHKTAENAHKHITDSSYEVQVFGKYNDLCGKVIIAVGYRISSAALLMTNNDINFDISITYSYHFERGDNLQKYITLYNRRKFITAHTVSA